MPGEIVVGVDIGTSKVCTLVGETGQGRSVQLIGLGVAPCQGLRKGSIVDLSAATRSIRESVSMAAKQAQVEARSVTIGITGEHVESFTGKAQITVSGPMSEITDSDRDRALETVKSKGDSAELHLLHVLPRYFSVDGHEQIQRPVGMTGRRLEVEAHVISSGRSAYDNLMRAISRAELCLDPAGVVLESLAAAEAVLTPEERQVGVALVNIGAGTTDIAVFHRGTVLHTKVIPVGGWNVTHDLSLGLQVADEEAERLKIEHGTALAELVEEDEIIDVNRPGMDEPLPLPRRLLAQIIQPRAEELFELVREEIVKSGIGKPGAGVVITGGSALLRGTLEVADRTLEGMEVRMGLPRCAGGIADRVAKPPFATAVGLVMWAARQEDELHEAEEGSLLSPMHRGLRRFVRSVFKSGARR